MNIQVYADTISAETEVETMNVLLTNVDIGLLFGQFTINDILSELDYSDIVDWISAQREDE